MEGMAKTQKEMIKEYLEKFGSITPYEAFRDLGITKLSTRIGEMKTLGIKIGSRKESAKNRYGKKVRYCRYWLADKVEQDTKGILRYKNNARRLECDKKAF